ncbi:hypothetical protein [Blastococcus sp. VKM Ac-2987]|uniref:hypothetical protein n=1 Tax=Blastococcus sp. VKM Ac-2987 TaxID=3004141 RepID=UPI0022AB6C7B|nr:hypothetical protein [Blastococcus sp. VKM Ac-2987]MCZ2857872.1 hypothetical protein [Blastococcus sp. VKM Ac-2987]
MSDLYIDGAVLARVRSDLLGIRDLLEQPAREMREVSGAAMGAPALARRMDEFGDEWAYGIGRLGGFAADAAEALDSVAAAFREADVSLSAALRDAGGR